MLTSRYYTQNRSWLLDYWIYVYLEFSKNQTNITHHQHKDPNHLDGARPQDLYRI